MTKHSLIEPKSYVVRVYRRTARWFAGYVEDVRSGRVRQFRTAADLWAAIGGPKHAAIEARPPRKRTPPSPSKEP
jgi:hypothetical protein